MKTLERAILMSRGQFSLVLVRCRYAHLRRETVARIRATLHRDGQPLHWRVVEVPPSARSLYPLLRQAVVAGAEGAAEEGRIAPGDRDPSPSASASASGNSPAPLPDGMPARQPDALMVYGLEGVRAIDELLALANQTRDRFRRHLPCPVVLWMDDEVLHRLARLAPDFKSWAATTIRIEARSESLREFVRRRAAAALAAAANPSLTGACREGGGGRSREEVAGSAEAAPRSGDAPPETLRDPALKTLRDSSPKTLRERGAMAADPRRRELEAAREDLQQRGEPLPPALDADLEFALGWDAQTRGRWEAAIAHYEASLDFWTAIAAGSQGNEPARSEPESSGLDGSGLDGSGLDSSGLDSSESQRPESERPESERPESERPKSERPESDASEISTSEVSPSEFSASDSSSSKTAPSERSFSEDSFSKDSFSEISSSEISSSEISTSELPPSEMAALEVAATEPGPEGAARENRAEARIRQAIAEYCRGTCARHRADCSGAGAAPHLETARSALETALDACRAGDRPDLYAQFVGELGRVLCRLEDWDALETLALDALRRHGPDLPPTLTRCAPLLLAQDCGFLAEVALSRQRWREADRYARRALDSFARLFARLGRASDPDPSSDASPDPSVQSLGELAPQDLQALRSQQSYYLLLLAEAQWGLNQSEAAIGYLEQARIESHPARDRAVQLRLLTLLRKLYFQQGRYLDAFRIKQEQRAVAHQSGLLAFIGAGQLQSPRPGRLDGQAAADPLPEIVASGRQQDLERLLSRLGRPDCKLTAIHGRSGVGKSSTVKAGLVPLLQQRSIGDRDVLPVVLEVYANWADALEVSLNRACDARGLADAWLAETWADLALSPTDGRGALADSPPGARDGASWESRPANAPAPSPSGSAARTFAPLLRGVLDRIRANVERNFLVVLIFDQFEEFFFAWPGRAERQQCFEFLRDCLNIPYVKLVLSLREDYLHFLLEWERSVDLAVVDNNVLDRSIRYRLGDFTPQDARATIENLTARSRFSLEPALIDALVEDLARDTGTVHPIELQIVGAQLQAEGISTLADYQAQLGSNKRVLVEHYLEETLQDCGPDAEPLARQVLFRLTHENGTRPLKTRTELASDLGAGDDRLGLVLNILVGAGLVVVFREASADFYQLVHDYLVPFIRQQQSAAERARFRLTEAQLNRVLERRVRELYAAGFVLVGLALSSIGFAVRTAIGEATAKIDAATSSAEALLQSEQEFDALLTGLRAADRRRDNWWLVGFDPRTRLQVAATLQQAIASVREFNRLEGHENIVWDASFSPDGSLIASASSDRTVRLWRPTGELVGVLKEPGADTTHPASVTNASFSPDGQLIATAGGEDGPAVKLWTAEGEYLRTIGSHDGAIYSLAFSPDGRAIATASQDKTVKLWDLSGQLLRVLAGHTDEVEWVAFSPDGTFLASASNDRTARLWDLTGREPPRILKGHQDWVFGIAFSPDGQTVATASLDKTVKLWDRQGQLLDTFTGHEEPVYNVTFSPDGTMVASTSEDRTAKLWDLKGNELQSLRGHTDRVTNVTFSPDGQTIATSSYDKTLRLWRLEPAISPAIPNAHGDRIHGLAATPDGQAIASAGTDGRIRLWDRQGRPALDAEGKPRAAIQVAVADPSRELHALAIAPDGERLAVGTGDGRVELRRWADGSLERALGDGQGSQRLGHGDRVRSLAFSPDGRILASASRDGTVKLWSPDGGELLATLALPASARDRGFNAVAFSPNGKLLATGSDSNTLDLWRPDGTRVRTLEGHTNYVADVVFSPDGRLLASAGGDNTVRLWSRDGMPLKVLKEGHSDTVNTVRFSPDGQLLASGGWDGTVALWDRDGRLLKSFRDHRDSVNALRFLPDSQTLVSASNDQQLMFRNLDLGDLLEAGCDWLQDYLTYNPTGRSLDLRLCPTLPTRAPSPSADP